jgi:apolipoprotein N-acyltransferase
LIALALLFVVLLDQPLRARLVLASVTGLAWFSWGLAWAVDFSIPGALALIVIETVIVVALLGLLPIRTQQWWTFPAVLALFTAVHDRFPFGGVPLSGIELSFAGSPLAPVVALGGTLALVAIAGLIGSSLSVSIRHRRITPVAVGLVVTIAAVVGADLATDKLTHKDGEITVAVVQGGGPRGVRAVDTNPTDVFNRTVQVAGQVRPPVDLVLWPENVVDLDAPLAGSATEATIAGLAQQARAPVIVGVTEPAGLHKFRNEAVLYDAQGLLVDRYDKVHRVPFGEYVPARSFLDTFADLSLVPSDAVAGHRPGLLRANGHAYGVVISYEVFFADRARAAINAGGQLLLVPTNASSYTGSAVPAQEVATARLRARETGRAVVQAAPTGYSAVTRADGSVVVRSKLGKPALLTERVPLRSGRTPYTRIGDWPVVAGAVLVLILGAALRRRAGST